MCVKEFLGYNCGHCSVPVLYRCPLSASNHVFPVCKWPAERPVFTNEYCHPCSRVLWNANVLKAEEEHRARHLAGECLCEVIFEGEDREKRLRPRGRKILHKGKAEEVVEAEHSEHEMGQGGGGEQTIRSEGDADMIRSDLGAYRGHVFAAVESGSSIGDQHANKEHSESENVVKTVKEDTHMDNMVINVEEPCSSQAWKPQTQNTSYEYLGYYISTSQNQGTHSTDPSFVMSLDDSYHQGQIPKSQAGAGMKWHPPENYSAISSAGNIYRTHTGEAPRGPRATSEPIGKYDYSRPSAEHQSVLTQPMVVSSDMTRA